MNEKTTHPLAGNPYTDADGVIDAVIFSADDSPMQATEMLLDQLKSATLALVFEQRTANLISLFGEDFPHAGLTSPEWAAIRDQVHARLGLVQS